MANGYVNNDNGKEKDTLRSTKDNEMMRAQDGQHQQHGTRCLLRMVVHINVQHHPQQHGKP